MHTVPIENYSAKPFVPVFQQIQFDTLYSGSLSGGYICPIPDNIENHVKLYKITFENLGQYTFTVNSVGDSDPDLAISYPNTEFGVDAIRAAMQSDYCPNSENLDQYFQSYSFSGGNDAITGDYSGGDTVYILVLSYNPGDFTFIVSPA